MTVEYVQRVSRCRQVSREICEHSNATMLQRCILSAFVFAALGQSEENTVYCCEIMCARLLFEEVSA